MTLIERAIQRQNQLLDAATTCFHENGFHRTTMQEISVRAKMSPGVIYHYFENKEAIIRCIVQRETEEAETFFNEVANSDQDIRQLLLDCTERGFAKFTDPGHFALRIEMAAEATRNHVVADILQHADVIKRSNLSKLVRAALRNRLSDDDIASRIEIMMSIFEGMASRIIRNPGLDPKKTLDEMKMTLSFVLRD